ncbi:MAG: tartrate dehydrogenase, partial [Blautia sp.]|nr:tartrate dehydrogenase [Blautia sp.]
MKEYKIAVIPGDGIGPEVMEESMRLLDHNARKDRGFSFSFTTFPWGCTYYLEKGEMMPKDGLDILKEYDAILLGAVGFPGVPDHISLRELLLEIRHGFDQYINLRPVKLLRGASCPLADVKPEDIDMIFVRENTEGEYSGSGAWLYPNSPQEVVIQD